MSPRLFRVVALVSLAAAGFWGWRLFFPSPEKIIRQRLAEIAVAASITPNEAPLTRLAKTQRLGSLLTADAQVSLDLPGRTSQHLNGRDEIQQAVMYARSVMSSMTIKFLDITVSVSADKRAAVAHLTATADMPGEKLPEVQELEVSFARVDRDWLIQRVDSVKTLR